MRKLSLFLSAVAIVTLQACIYRMDIPQGNRIDASSLEQLKPGMTRSQVVFLLGEAAINDQYHANQAHYVYYLYQGEQQTSELKTMTLTYEDNVLVEIEGTL
jgi:outer membrane protein assembly factor BamE